MSIDDMIVGDNDHIQAHGDAGIPDLSDAAIGAASPAVPPSPASSDGGSAAAVLPSLPSLVPPSRLLHRLAELDLGGCGNLTDAGLEALVGAAPLLSRLNLTVNALLRTPRSRARGCARLPLRSAQLARRGGEPALCRRAAAG